MATVRAFVGHSFDDNDKDLVRAFLDYLDSIKDALDLEWQHAEKAEPRELAEKVRALMKGKNLFIGILSSKEYKVSPDKIRLSLLGRSHCAKTEHLIPCTSEWIVQESGYALALKMHMILLLEAGVHLGAGLQGDIEYITFTRRNPSTSFQKLHEMLWHVATILREPISGEVHPPTVAGAATIEKAEDVVEMVDTTTNTWADLHVAVYIDKDLEKAKKIVDAITSTDPSSRASWESLFLRFQIGAGFEGALGKLEEMVKDESAPPQVLMHLGHVYSNQKRFKKAAELFSAAAAKTVSREGKISSLVLAAENLIKDDKTLSNASDLLLSEFPAVSTDRERHLLCRGLAHVFKTAENDNLFFSFSEKALEYEPNDHETRFALAYRYSDVKLDALSFYHYKILCERQDHGMNWNNLGVQCSKLNMKSAAIKAYRKAADHNETLAMANIAHSYIHAGFLDDAQALVQAGRLIGGYHSDIDAAMVAINNTTSEEEKLKDKELEEGAIQRRFLRDYADAVLTPRTISAAGEWEGRHGKISLSFKDGDVAGLGQYLVPTNIFARALAGLNSLPTPPVKYITTLKGKIINGGAEYVLTIKEENAQSTILGGGEKEYKGLMILGDFASIRVMEHGADNKATFYTLKRATSDYAPST